ncbi:sensor histidine kinase [Nocardioides sp. HDW12B]|uniref:sensor histidine kinase n=1 Tax=Nocardioides sp. HDW12B TaxID=2714939 RepID=UPI00140A81C8|nr:histidine kinase [Nocardioides sp. HDW12B]QIK67640.1 sensor histidine kinase [Nocardioides sp. HDW12B]
MAVWRRGARWRRTGHLSTEADRATFRTLHTASLAAPALRGGLTRSSAERAVGHLRVLLGTPSVVLTDTSEVLAWDGSGAHHRDLAERFARELASEGSGATTVHDRDFRCDRPGCEAAHAVVSPLAVDDVVVGTLQVFAPAVSAGLVRATDEVAAWVTGQLALADLEESRRRLVEAEVKTLRAQISPHFIYNSLNAIASFVRTDPEHARELLLEFADFTRYSFRSHGEFTTLAEELRSIERYLVLEQARFGDRLHVTLRVAPEVLPVTVPFLCLQPLVENAVRHGLEAKDGPGRIEIVAEDHASEAVIWVEDDGVGDDPERVRRALAGESDTDSVGLGNVDGRLRSVFGDEFGLVVETAVGAGTRVTVRVPKFAPGVHA